MKNFPSSLQKGEMETFKCVVCKIREEEKCQRCSKCFCDRHVAVIGSHRICRRCFKIGDLKCFKCAKEFSSIRTVSEPYLCDVCSKPVVVFFPGFGMPMKRYESFLEKVGEHKVYQEGFEYDPSQSYVAIAHSIGIYNAIYFSDKYKVKTIVSLDGSSLRDEIVLKRLTLALPDSVRNSYEKWLTYSKTCIPKSVVVLFCDQSREDEECDWYNDIYFHDLGEEFKHHPYMKKEVVTRVLLKLN